MQVESSSAGIPGWDRTVHIYRGTILPGSRIFIPGIIPRLAGRPDKIFSR